jgi:predicted amidophosphoribosyltransferase
MNSRIKRESKIVKKMIELYCRKHHSARDLCPECLELINYAQERLMKCPFQGDKTTCAKCPVHCYNPAKREQIRFVMRYSGPQMLFYYPIAAIQHIFDGRRQKSITRSNK